MQPTQDEHGERLTDGLHGARETGASFCSDKCVRASL